MAIKINVFGPIWDETAERIDNDLEEAAGEDIEVLINSPGGSLFACLHAFNSVSNYKGSVTTHIMGLAASGASLLVLAGDDGQRIAESNTIGMIHNAQGCVCGDYIAMARRAAVLESMSIAMAEEYARVTGKSMVVVRKKMDAETFFFGKELKTFGLVDKIVNAKKEKSRATAESEAVLVFEKFTNELKQHEISEEEITKIAAHLQIENMHDIGSKNAEENINDENNNNSEDPTKIKFKREDSPMAEKSLKDHMETDAGVKTEVEALKKDKFDEGIKKGAEDMDVLVKATAPYLGKTEYPEAIQNLAIEVLKREKPLAALEGAVTTYDAIQEKEKADAALKEEEKNKETPSGGSGQEEGDGVIRTEADFEEATKTD